MRKLLLLLAFFSVSIIHAQNRISDHNQIGWFSTTITPAISNKVSGHIEYQWRRDNFIKDWQQSLLRVGVNYKFHPQVTAHIGYAWIETYPYGEYALSGVPKQFPEHRIYEQLVVNSPVGKVNLMHRLRLEQRWLGRLHSMASEGADEYIYLNRARYMPRVDIPIGNKWFAAAYDEIFIGFGKNVGENVFDQNRIGLMIGYKANNNFRVEGGFLNQTVQLGREINNRNVYQYNNGFIINTYFNF
ncbi:DUF2490 domain-containing protein [Aridibaculum aurantiacum]|uniref:DUF2490 domain-containing protein n=1 Tax=Aridibaculum aurantiacum TaxID=2810307 RepID=UPI001A95806D|nr:DUF2490 domain-containing protein [Aridibaculum aurantiacum]